LELSNLAWAIVGSVTMDKAQDGNIRPEMPFALPGAGKSM
jgi:hypothetical protein